MLVDYSLCGFFIVYFSLTVTGFNQKGELQALYLIYYSLRMCVCMCAFRLYIICKSKKILFGHLGKLGQYFTCVLFNPYPVALTRRAVETSAVFNRKVFIEPPFCPVELRLTLKRPRFVIPSRGLTYVEILRNTLKVTSVAYVHN